MSPAAALALRLLLRLADAEEADNRAAARRWGELVEAEQAKEQPDAEQLEHLRSERWHADGRATGAGLVRNLVKEVVDGLTQEVDRGRT